MDVDLPYELEAVAELPGAYLSMCSGDHTHIDARQATKIALGTLLGIQQNLC